MSFDCRDVGFATASEFIRIEERADERIRVEVRLGKRLAQRTATRGRTVPWSSFAPAVGSRTAAQNFVVRKS
jgi:hypothetical protein